MSRVEIVLLDSPTLRALQIVADERRRQEQRKAEGRFTHTCADTGPGSMSNAERYAVLGEEFGEALEEWDTLARQLGICMGRVAREVLTQDERRLARDTVGTREQLRAELVQVAAVAVAWVESLSAAGSAER